MNSLMYFHEDKNACNCNQIKFINLNDITLSNENNTA